MEIPRVQSTDLDFLFQFSPEPGYSVDSCVSAADTGHSGDHNIGQVQLPAACYSPTPAAHTDIKSLDSSELSRKKHKFYTEMKTTHKLEKSRQSARECRARKKLRYQYLDDLILERERANERLRGEMTKFVSWCNMMDQNNVPEGMQEFINNVEENTAQS
eukprot:TRINITY_DN57431_c0_g1_i1.p1 TRINITY_DN57431_c0_g1~~TRINITY_DN57431_c0_g1_i1.p1  ORF type:complete len:160 (-),score=46.31 TRINITY_DN57431_c0_g1_i1:43-522(-)